MKAIVTGGAGFIGSHLVTALISRGADVHVIDNLSTGCLEYVHPQAHVHVEDLNSTETEQILLREKPDYVFHLAAQADVQKSILKPSFDAEVNLLGTIRLLEACHKASVRKVIFSSTSGVYGNLQKETVLEDDHAHPISCYGLSKHAGEAYLRLFYDLYGLSFTILRYGNVYGPRQTAKGEGGVIALLIDKLKQSRPFTIHGDGEQTRDFVYVEDVVQANLASVALGDQETLHVSTGHRTSINQLIRFLEDIHGSQIRTHHGPQRPGDIRHSCLANRRAFDVLRWKPQFDIKSGLHETYNYHVHEGGK